MESSGSFPIIEKSKTMVGGANNSFSMKDQNVFIATKISDSFEIG
jgi:hypothetical protein